MKIETEINNNSKIVYILGNLDTINANSIEVELSKIVESLVEETLIISLKEVKFISSTGLRVLVKTFKDCGLKGKNLKLVDLGRAVEQAILIVKLDTLFTIYPTLSEALHS